MNWRKKRKGKVCEYLPTEGSRCDQSEEASCRGAPSTSLLSGWNLDRHDWTALIRGQIWDGQRISATLISIRRQDKTLDFSRLVKWDHLVAHVAGLWWWSQEGDQEEPRVWCKTLPTSAFWITWSLGAPSPQGTVAQVLHLLFSSKRYINRYRSEKSQFYCSETCKMHYLFYIKTNSTYSIVSNLQRDCLRHCLMQQLVKNTRHAYMTLDNGRFRTL